MCIEKLGKFSLLIPFLTVAMLGGSCGDKAVDPLKKSLDSTTEENNSNDGPCVSDCESNDAKGSNVSGRSDVIVDGVSFIGDGRIQFGLRNVAHTATSSDFKVRVEALDTGSYWQGSFTSFEGGYFEVRTVSLNDVAALLGRTLEIKFTIDVDGVLNEANVSNNQFKITHMMGMQTAPFIKRSASGLVLNYSSATISWGGDYYFVMPNISGHKIERSLDQNSWQVVGTITDSAVTDYNISGLSPLTDYYFRVYAYNEAGNGPYSDVVKISTVAGPPPKVSSLTASAASPTKINLQWSDVNGESQYVIKRALGSGAFLQISSLSANTTSFSDESAMADSTYTYAVVAQNAAGESAPTLSSAISTPPASQSAVTGLVVNVTPSSPVVINVSLSWDNLPSEEFFEIERKISGGQWAFLQKNNANDIDHAYLETGCNVPSIHYRVRALSQFSVTGPYSNEAMVTCPPPVTSSCNADALSATQVKLTWSNVDREIGYKIFRQLLGSGTPASVVSTAAAESTLYLDLNVQPNKTYRYTIKAFNSSGDGPEKSCDVTTPAIVNPEN